MPSIFRAALLERVTSPSARVDRSAGVIRGVRILGKQSRNGREYTSGALDDAARLYEDAPVNIDHPDRSHPGAERSFNDQIGCLRNVRRKGDGVFGDLHYLKSHPLAEMLCESAERFPRRFGLSHNADGRTSRKGGKVFVESLEEVRSVDIVCKPATNNGLFESEDATAALMAGFRNAVAAIFDDDSQDLKGKLASIKILLHAQEQVLAKLDGGEEPEEPADDEHVDSDGLVHDSFGAKLPIGESYQSRDGESFADQLRGRSPERMQSFMETIHDRPKPDDGERLKEFVRRIR